MNVRFTPRALRRARIVTSWWRTHRTKAPDLFERELALAIQRLAADQNVGLVYSTTEGRVVRRLLLSKSEQHVYYAVDEDTQTVIVLNVWGARRGRAPRL